MKINLVFTLVVAMFVVVFALPKTEMEPNFIYYHEEIGIPEANRIAAYEKMNEKLIESRIINGQPSTLGKFPHFAGLYITLTDGTKSVCGSSLISKTRLITAAHCWIDKTAQAVEFEVVLGSTTLTRGGKRIKTRDVVTHELWNTALKTQNDIAIISIPPVKYSRTIHNIALPFGDRANDNFEGLKAVAVGFGLQSDEKDVIKELRHVSLRVISNDECRKTFNYFVTPSVICAHGLSNKNTCRGDSGGPLQIYNNGTPILIGITAFGLLSCETGEPGAYTRISSYLDWIRNKL